MKPALNVHAALSGKRVLITGSTGFLAKVVLEKLIRSVPDIGRIVLVIRGGRGKTSGDARTRFERDIATSSVFDRLRAERPGFLAEFFAERIECVTGEVTEPCFGLSLAEFNALARRIDLVINAAASVNFREALDVRCPSTPSACRTSPSWRAPTMRRWCRYPPATSTATTAAPCWSRMSRRRAPPSRATPTVIMIYTVYSNTCNTA